MRIEGYIKYVIVLLVCFAVFSSKAQENDSLFYYRGQIISKDGKYPVALAHVINLKKKCGVIADTTGYFEIWVMPGDTLNISAIGFDFLELPVPVKYKDTTIDIYLQNRYYEIPEVSITYLGTYKDFEYKVLNLELPGTGINGQVEKLFKHVDLPPLVMGSAITGPASLIYVLFSKEAKAIKKYLELSEEGVVKDKVRVRYNEYIVKNLTGLVGVEAFEFMKFCNFQDKYILSIDDYNLYSEIYLRFKAFKKSKPDSLISE